MDLEAELLALAGEEDEDDLKIESSPQRPIPSSPKKRQRAPPAKRSRKKPRRDDNSDGDDDDDVKDEQSDTHSDQESFDGSSQSERDAPMDIPSESEEEDVDGDQGIYPLEGKYKDHADKDRLLGMTEVAREAVLAERMLQIEREQQDRHLRNLLKSRKTADKAKSDAANLASTRKSLRTKSSVKNTEEATKRGKLDELRRTREERRATGRRSSFGDEDASKRMMSDDEEEDNYREETRVKDDRPISLDDVNKCRIGRSAFGKLCDYPGFDEVVADMFVRVSMFDKESNRTVYRMAQIKGFTTGKPYTMLEGSRRTDQHLRVLHGKSERDFPMDMMSDSRFTEQEFNRFKNQLEIDKVPLPPKSHLEAKAKALAALAMRPLTDEEIQTMIAKRNKGKGDFIKSATTRRVLNEQREIAVAEGNDAEVIRLDRELQELEDQNAGPARGETQMQRMARLNVENRKRNQAEVRMAEIAEKRAAREALARSQKDGGSYANPFMRVKTSVKFRHDIDESSAGKSKEVAVGGSPPIKAEDGKAPNGVGLLGPAKGRKKGGVDDVIASMDLGIEIDI